jgi:hypothetical protein
LRQQGNAQDMQGVRMPGIPRKSLAGEALGLGRALLLERFYGKAETIVDRCRRAAAALCKLRRTFHSALSSRQ